MISKIRIWQGTTVVFASLSLVLTFLLLQGTDEVESDASDRSPSVSTPPESGRNRAGTPALIEANDPVLGDMNAEISVIEFSDFQCPYCARFFASTHTEFRNSELFTDGRVNWVYKHFPLNRIHPQAQKAAEASECANRQGEFWDYHDALFANQTSLDVASLKSYAAELGLNAEEFNRCLDEGEARSEIRKELSMARAAGGRGTPYFVILNNTNGKGTSVRGAVPYDRLMAAINSVL